MFDVIMYLFENYLHREEATTSNSDVLLDELEMAGFPKAEIEKAFNWYAGLADCTNPTAEFVDTNRDSLRIYTGDESKKFGRRGLGFLTFLGQTKVLTPRVRETIIDRALAIESKRIDIEQLKWITLMVMFHHADDKDDSELNLAWMENLLFSETEKSICH